MVQPVSTWLFWTGPLFSLNLTSASASPPAAEISVVGITATPIRARILPLKFRSYWFGRRGAGGGGAGGAGGGGAGGGGAGGPGGGLGAVPCARKPETPKSPSSP